MNELDITKGEHMTAADFDLIPAGQLGATQLTPYICAPADWKKNGVPYGAWCRCCECGVIGRSTLAFDFYAIAPGDALTCETCSRRKI